MADTPDLGLVFCGFQLDSSGLDEGVINVVSIVLNLVLGHPT